MSSKRWFGGRAYHSISSLAKEKGIRRETVKRAIESGDLKTRRLEGRKHHLILEEDVQVWWNSLREGNSAAGDKPGNGKSHGEQGNVANDEPRSQ